MWFEIAFLCIISDIIFELYLNYRQLKHLKRTKEPVEIFRKEISKEEFQKSLDYQIALTKFDIASIILSFSFLSPFLVHKFWFFVDYENEILHSIVFLVLQNVFDTIISIPFKYYKKFVINEKFGFNNSTIKLFVTDLIKEFIIGNLFYVVLFCPLIWMYKWGGSKFIMYAFFFFIAFIIIIQVLYPILILPLFTKLSPLQDAEVKQGVNDLAHETNFNLKEIYQTDDSKRSSKQNAFMFGLFTHKIALADTLLEKCNVDEIKAVVGHEIGHSKHNHTWKLIILNQLSFTITVFALDMIMKFHKIFNEFGFYTEFPFIIGISISSFFSTPIEKMLTLPINMIIRYFEYQADEFSASLGLKLEEALLKISQENKSAVDPEPIYSAFNDSHPTLYQRIVAIRKIQKRSN